MIWKTLIVLRIGIAPLITLNVFSLIAMSSLPNVGPCKFCDAHATRTCSVCGEFYCSQACQMALTDKPQEKLKAAAEEDDVTGALTTEEVSSKEYQAKRKGFRVDAKVFEKNQGAREGVYKIISIDDNVKLQEVDDFKTELLTLSLPFAKLLENWKLFLGDEIHQFVSSARFEWNMGLFGSVTYEGVFNRKATTLTLYKKRHTPYHWMIMYEPLSNDPNIFFDDLHAFMASCPAIMLGSVI